MTEYEMRKIAKMQATFMVEALKADDELMDLVYPPRLMDIKEAAEYLRIPVNTLYQKVNEIPHEKIGKRLIFSDRGLVRWMKRSSRDGAVEIPIRRKAM